MLLCLRSLTLMTFVRRVLNVVLRLHIDVQIVHAHNTRVFATLSTSVPAPCQTAAQTGHVQQLQKTATPILRAQFRIRLCVRRQELVQQHY